ncbi:tetratricopeptide repeat protein [Thiofilum flexile]|uniref:tetratricopeptide repeat protein n=1 Tax=Thiofilum flexile TaxID=125627 RepID=UPI00036765C7|nr:tetratricopeptide repeat protein [Thiofilum flexile]
MSNPMPDEVDLASAIAAFEAKNFALAMRLLSPFADVGHAQAQHLVAIMHQNGLGVIRNELAAYKWMKASAEQGYGLAQHGLGFMYLEGECAPKNLILAKEWLQKAADQGLEGSLALLAYLKQSE